MTYVFAALGLALAATPAPSVSLTLLGHPTKEAPPSAQAIQTIFGHRGRLYLGHGNWSANTGPTALMSYDPAKGNFEKEFLCHDEAVVTFREVEGLLVVPGVDATENWEYGNVYVRRPAGWTKYRSLEKAVHVFDVAAFQGAWYAATGNSHPRGGQQQPAGVGAIHRSRDQGRTWDIAYATRVLGPSRQVHRFHRLAVLGDRLFVFPTGIMSTTPELEGGRDVLTFDGTTWTWVDVFRGVQEPPAVSFAAAWGNRLIMNVPGYPPHTAPSTYVLHAFDGATLTDVPTPLDRGGLIQPVVCGPRLVLLGYVNRQLCIAFTTDLKKWEIDILSWGEGRATSVWMEDDRLYLGDGNGRLWSTTIPKQGLKN